MTDTQPRTLDEALPRIRAVLQAAAKGSAERDLTHEHPYELVQQLADAGFGRLRITQEYGGFDVDLPTLFALLAEAGQADSNLPQIWRGHFTTTEILRRETDAEVRRHWSKAIAAGIVFGNAQSEPAALVRGADDPSGWGALTTHIRRDSDGRRVVSGTKFYSTGARFADYIRTAALDEDGNRVFAVLSANHTGVAHIDDWDGVGQRQTGSGTTIFEEVPVEPHGDIGRDVSALRGLDSFVQIVHLANLAGIARSIVAETVDIVRARTRTGQHALTQDAASDPEVLAVVGTLYARRLTAETLLRHAAENLELAHHSGRETDYAEAYVETSAAQLGVIDAVLDAATIAFNAGGSSTVRTRVHLDRHWRNARTLASHNPIIYKPRVIGDYLVNDSRPVSGYYRDRPKARSDEESAL
ncbi:acyl-CoA dehydrogenase family protein [Mycobacterium aquaticum]|uniref:Acyl-CoA dehydrogenase n=1 Tax=Mycobacterium aquaticum TaxID=1927124 RepID=A0A1X0BAE5_9MYCO|nr:acyl-CoA dehydrogenase family protein [Mycobacterium aquaticum]ORA39290.1 acyl-CoA dehydrogenase [Mycobacterium aquaticum]